MSDVHRPEAMLVMSDRAHRTLFDESRHARLGELARLADPAHVTALDTPSALGRLGQVEVLITSWGCPPLDHETLEAAPNLRAVLHAAGSIKKHITDACWDRKLLVTTAAESNAVPVAEFTLAAILFAGKRVPQNMSAFARHQVKRRVADGSRFPAGEISNYQRTVGIVGFSRIGRRVAALLEPFDLDVQVADPYADADEVAAAGGRLIELERLLKSSDIVSLHAPALPTTKHLLDATRLRLLADHATVINTARGMLIDTAALAAECASGRLSAILDVTDPEPVPSDSPLWHLPNVWLTPHIAGAQHTEVHRLADAALDELERYTRGEPPHYPVTREQLDRIA